MVSDEEASGGFGAYPASGSGGTTSGATGGKASELLGGWGGADDMGGAPGKKEPKAPPENEPSLVDNHGVWIAQNKLVAHGTGAEWEFFVVATPIASQSCLGRWWGIWGTSDEDVWFISTPNVGWLF